MHDVLYCEQQAPPEGAARVGSGTKPRQRLKRRTSAACLNMIAPPRRSSVPTLRDALWRGMMNVVGPDHRLAEAEGCMTLWISSGHGQGAHRPGGSCLAVDKAERAGDLGVAQSAQPVRIGATHLLDVGLDDLDEEGLGQPVDEDRTAWSTGGRLLGDQVERGLQPRTGTSALAATICPLSSSFGKLRGSFPDPPSHRESLSSGRRLSPRWQHVLWPRCHGFSALSRLGRKRSRAAQRC